MKLRFLLSPALLLAVLPAFAGAEDISFFTATVTASSPIQLGRLSRNNVQQQTWTGAEAFPGVINTAVAYNYMTYTFAASNFLGAPYVEISDFDTLSGTSDFLSAYAGLYNPLNPATNWLGDEGTSGNLRFFANDPGEARFFDVILPVGQNLVLVLNTTAAAGLNDPQQIDVSAYADTNLDDPIPVAATPEPSTFITFGTGLIGIAGAARRRFKANR